MDAFLNFDVFAGDTWEGDWFVNAGLDWFWVGNGYINIDGGDNWYVVLSFLGNFVAVLMSISTMSVATMSVATTISTTRLADCDHLGLRFLLEGNFDGLGDGSFILWFIAVCADLVGDNFNGFSADSSDNWVALFYRDDDLDGQFYICAGGGNSGCAYLGLFGDIND